MTITTLLTLFLTATPVQPKIVAASVFKNGFAVLMREIDVPSAGEYSITKIPQSSLGTLWFSATDGSTIDSLKTVTHQSPSETTASDLGLILQANLGKDLELGLKDGDTVSGKSVGGKLLSTEGDIVVMESARGSIAIPKSSITSIAAEKGALVYTLATSKIDRSLELKVSGHGGKVFMISMERGLTWVPGYSVDMTEKKTLVLTTKASLINDLEDLNAVDCNFVTGFPNVPYAGILDPLVSGQSVDEFTTVLQNANPSSVTAALTSNRLGGQGVQSFGAELVSQGGNFVMPAEQGMRLGDLFFYDEPGLSLNKGDRGFYMLFRTETPYKEVYTWDVADPVYNNFNYAPSSEDGRPADVWHTLQFKNSSGHPLTTGVATTFKENHVIGQDTLGYVSAGGDAELKITKALDVQAENSEEEVTRERGAIKNTANFPIYDQVTMKGTLQIKNLNAEEVTLRIKHPFTGELTSADGNPANKNTAKGLHDINPSGLLTWSPTLAAGKSLVLTYTYKVFVHTP